MRSESGKSPVPGAFAAAKKRHLKTLEKAVEKSLIDEGMIPLCRDIAKTKNYFTSSSCAGRIMLLEVSSGESKKDSVFRKRWHREVSPEEVMKAVDESNRRTLWLRAEPFIIHIGCSSQEAAEKLLLVKEKAGIRRGGISAIKGGKYMVELTGSQYLSAPVKEGRKLLVTDSYLMKLAETANRKLKLNSVRLKRFRTLCRGMLE
jgi:tRNA wybutosine-synthesizing protein 3